jgi:hypothetical protein
LREACIGRFTGVNIAALESVCSIAEEILLLEGEEIMIACVCLLCCVVLCCVRNTIGKFKLNAFL